MTKQTMKPVWRINTGNGVPGDYVVGNKIFHERGDCAGIGGFAEKILEIKWRLVGDGENIYAYQTTRTKAAKVYKAICEDCMGSGNEIDWNDENCLPIEGTCCQSCDGKGEYREFIVGVKQ